MIAHNKLPTILIVEDELVNLNVLAEAFKDNYRLLIAKNGVQALTRVAQHDVDLILLDIMLPDVDGFEVCRRLKQNAKTRDIPVIFVSSKTDAVNEELGLHSGAVDYIGKPFCLPIVVARVETHIALKKKSDLLEELVAIDGLTNIYNRRKFNESFSDEFKRANRDGTPLSMAIIDVDYFKAYNDNYGHAKGDKALKQIADLLSHAKKRSHDFVARYGGEEFVVILPNTDTKGGIAYCQQLISALNMKAIPHQYSPVCEHITISIGGATYQPPENRAGQDTEERQMQFFDRVDAVLYEAKSAGRNQVIWTDF